MLIDIKQHIISIGDGYDIFTNGKRTFSAYTELLTLYPVINLCEYGSDRPMLSIEKMLSFLGPTYVIKQSGKEYTLDTVSWLKGHYECLVGDTMYTIYRHDNCDYSVFKGDLQIAYWTGQSVTFLEGDKYQIQADNSSNYKLLIAFCLIMDNYYNDSNGGSLISFNFLLFGFQKKPADKNWTPKI